MRDDPEEATREAPQLRLLRHLVTALTATLILGILAIVAILFARLGPMARPPALPPEVRLPEGESASAVTLGDDWLAVVTVDRAGTERIRVLDRATGGALSETEIRSAP